LDTLKGYPYENDNWTGVIIGGKIFACLAPAMVLSGTVLQQRRLGLVVLLYGCALAGSLLLALFTLFMMFNASMAF